MFISIEARILLFEKWAFPFSKCQHYFFPFFHDTHEGGYRSEKNLNKHVDSHFFRIMGFMKFK